MAGFRNNSDLSKSVYIFAELSKQTKPLEVKIYFSSDQLNRTVK